MGLNSCPFFYSACIACQWVERPSAADSRMVNREAFSLFYNMMGSLCSMNIMDSNFQKAITKVKTAYYEPLCPGPIFLSCEKKRGAFIQRGHTLSMLCYHSLVSRRGLGNC